MDIFNFVLSADLACAFNLYFVKVCDVLNVKSLFFVKLNGGQTLGRERKTRVDSRSGDLHRVDSRSGAGEPVM